MTRKKAPVGLTGGSGFHTRLGLQHALDEVLSSARESVLVVVDAAERLTMRATKVLGKTIRDIHQRTDVAGLLTAHGEAASRLVGWLRDAGLSEVEVVALERPSEDSISALLADFSGLKWTLFRPEVRPALRNLKVLEWIVQAVQCGEVLDETAILNVSGLIELLWRRWIEADSGDLGRSEALMRLTARLKNGTATDADRKDAAQMVSKVQGDKARLQDIQDNPGFFHKVTGGLASFTEEGRAAQQQEQANNAKEMGDLVKSMRELSAAMTANTNATKGNTAGTSSGPNDPKRGQSIVTRNGIK